MFQALGRTMFQAMLAVAGPTGRKAVPFSMVAGEAYDVATGATVVTSTTETVTGFWGPFSEKELGREGLKATDIKFTFPVGSLSRAPTVDDYAVVDGVKYVIYDTWEDAAAVQAIVCFRKA